MRITQAPTLSSLRASANSLFTLIAWLHVPAVVLIALVARNDWRLGALVLFIAAVVATVCARTMREGITLRCIMATALTLAPIAFVYVGRGHFSGIGGNGDWQIDYHMYFFAIFAMLVAYVDWRPIALAATLTALHHLVLDLIVPAGVFPEEGLDRVLLHALAVVAECSVLFWITGMLQALFERIHSVIDFTTKVTAEAIAGEIAEKSVLIAELEELRASQS
jgi:hypothetical protein